MGAAVVVGWTTSINFPTQNAFQASYGGGSLFGDAFVTRLPLSGGPPTYATYLGGSGDEYADALALDSSGAAVVAGVTSSTNFPTQNAFQTNYGGGSFDAFVTRLPLSGGPPTYSSYLGGSGYDWANALVLDSTGAAVVAGWTHSTNFPTQNAFQSSYGGGSFDGFVTRLPLSGGPPTYSTYLGGSGDDWAHALALDSTGAAVVAGWTPSTNFPTQNAFQTTFGGGTYDAFVAHLDLLPAGASVYGASTPGCAGPLPIGVTSIPQVGNSVFAITCGNAPPSTTGLLAFSGAGLVVPYTLGPLEIWIDPASPAFFTVFTTSAASGTGVVALPIPSNPVLSGNQVYAQFLWLDPCAAAGISASNALAITVQP